MVFPKKISIVYQFGYLFDDKKKNYYRDYLKEVKTYSTAMMKELNWNIIEKRVEKAFRKQFLENPLCAVALGFFRFLGVTFFALEIALMMPLNIGCVNFVQ